MGAGPDETVRSAMVGDTRVSAYWNFAKHFGGLELTDEGDSDYRQVTILGLVSSKEDLERLFAEVKGLLEALESAGNLAFHTRFLPRSALSLYEYVSTTFEGYSFQRLDLQSPSQRFTMGVQEPVGVALIPLLSGAWEVLIHSGDRYDAYVVFAEIPNQVLAEALYKEVIAFFKDQEAKGQFRFWTI